MGSMKKAMKKSMKKATMKKAMKAKKNTEKLSPRKHTPTERKHTRTLPNSQMQLKQHEKHLESKDSYQLEEKHQKDKHYSRRHEVSTKNRSFKLIFQFLTFLVTA